MRGLRIPTRRVNSPMCGMADRPETETEVWINETKRLFWIPPGLVHASRSQGPVGLDGLS